MRHVHQPTPGRLKASGRYSNTEKSNTHSNSVHHERPPFHHVAHHDPPSQHGRSSNRERLYRREGPLQGPSGAAADTPSQ